MKKRELAKKIGLPFLSLLLFVAVWQIAASALGVELILPTPASTFREFFAAFASGRFWASLGMSVLRTLVGFALSFVFALALAVLGKWSENFARFLSPLVTILRAVPTIAVIFIFMVFLSEGRLPVLISFLIVFPMLYEGFLAALRGVSGELADMSRLYRVPKSVQLRKFYIPAILPALFSVSRSAVGLNLKVVVAAEAIAYSELSLGRLLQNAGISPLDGARLLAYTLMAVLVSFLLEGIVLLLQKRFVRWAP